MNGFRECIGDIIIRAIERSDYNTIISLRKVFNFCARSLANYDGLNSGLMQRTLDDVFMGLEQGVDKTIIKECIKNIISTPSNENGYYALSKHINYQRYEDLLASYVNQQ